MSSETNVPEAESTVPSIPEAPKWINQEFMETALRTEDPNLTVTSYHVEPAVSAGENYACIVYRAIVSTAQHGNFSLIVKCIPENEFRAKFVREGGISTREILMYERILPLLKGSLDMVHYPHCYYILADGLKDTLVLRDLRPEGFRTRKRQLGLDFAHCRLALTELAHLHGLSVALKIQQPEVFQREIVEKCPDNFYRNDMRMKFEPFMIGIFNSLSDAIKIRLPFRFHALADMMRPMATYMFDVAVEAVKIHQDEDEILVLNHGDFWNNNFLFKYDNADTDENPQACYMVDFQIARCARPTLDLVYFFFSSTTQETRRNYMTELLEHYLSEVRRAIAEKGITDPGKAFYKNAQDIMGEIRKLASFAFLMACFLMPLVVADAKDTPDMDNIKEEDISKLTENNNPFLKMYSGSLFCQRMREILEDFDDMGLFNEFEARIEADKIKQPKESPLI